MKSSIRIGIDGRSLQGKITGIGRYVFELCKELDQLLPEATFFIYSQYPIEMPVISDRWLSRVDTFPFKRYMKSAVWLKLRCGKLCSKDNLDWFWAGSTLLPKLHRNIRTLTTVHDLNHLVVPDTMATPTLWSYILFFKNDVKKATVIAANSEGTAKRLLESYGLNANLVVTPSASSIFKVPIKIEIAACVARYRIQGKYILSVATWEPRKNIELLIDTFIKMKASGLLPLHKLVLAGGSGWKDARLKELISENISQDIVALGYVPDVDLPMLYAGSDVFVFPSIYEGFGMPVLEARLCGAQVVATDIPELREAGGDESIYILPTVDGIKKGILYALSHPSQPQGEKRNGAPLTWRVGAEKLARIFLS